MKEKKVHTRFNLKETDMYFLIGKALKATFGLPQNTLFFEVPIRGSRADILYVQTPNPYDGILGAGIHAFEVKMRWDNDRQRQEKQLRDYMETVDYVWLIGVNTILSSKYDNVGLLAFSTNGCKIETVRHARHNGKLISIPERQSLLTTVASELKNKYRRVEEMAWVNQTRESRIVSQEKLERYAFTT